ncbi:MAG: glycosyltransferase [Bacillota bacterium]|nr:glycosyltransferase [Bacillota bacterium]
MNRTVSIIIPVCDGKEYLHDMLGCVLNQSFYDYELIIIDDGSTDGSGELLDEFAVKHPQIKVFHQQRAGVSAARNKGLSAAMGKYIFFWDCDDRVSVDILEKMVSNAEMHIKSLTVCGIKWSFCETGKEQSVLPNCGEEPVSHFPLLYEDGLLSSLCNKIFSRSIIEKYKLKFDNDISMGEDLLFVLSYIRHISTFTFINEALYSYHIRGNKGLHVSFHENRFYGIARMYVQLKQLCDERGCNEDLLIIIKRKIIEEYSLALSDCVHPDSRFPMKKKLSEMSKALKSIEYRQTIDELDGASILPVLKELMRIKSALLLYIYFRISDFRKKQRR